MGDMSEGDRGSTVVKVLRYKSEGRWFDQVKYHGGELWWSWTARRLAIIRRTIPQNIPIEWTVFPECAIYPNTRHRAVLWILAQLVSYRMTSTAGDALDEYVEYIRRKKATMYQQPNRSKLVANYMCVIDKWSQTHAGTKRCEDARHMS
jgi:hypothetical protein